MVLCRIKYGQSRTWVVGVFVVRVVSGYRGVRFIPYGGLLLIYGCLSLLSGLSGCVGAGGVMDIIGHIGLGSRWLSRGP